MAFQLEAIILKLSSSFTIYTVCSYSNFTFKLFNIILPFFSFYKTLKLGVKKLPRMHVQVRDQNEQMHPHAHSWCHGFCIMIESNNHIHALNTIIPLLFVT